LQSSGIWILERTPGDSRGSSMQLFLTAFESVPDPRAEKAATISSMSC
jgi:hypothetical protein